MNNLHLRMLGFLIGCIGIRLYIVYLAKTIDPKYLPYMGLLAILISFIFALIYLLDLRKTGMETFGNEIWWNYLRPYHAGFYLIFALALSNLNYSNSSFSYSYFLVS